MYRALVRAAMIDPGGRDRFEQFVELGENLVAAGDLRVVFPLRAVEAALAVEVAHGANVPR